MIEKYIHNNEIVDEPQGDFIKSHLIEEQKDYYVILNEEQINYHLANPKASALEVWLGSAEAIDELTAIKNQLLSKFQEIIKQFTIDISTATIINGTNNEQLNQLITTIKMVRIATIKKIEAITSLENAKNFEFDKNVIINLQKSLNNFL